MKVSLYENIKQVSTEPSIYSISYIVNNIKNSDYEFQIESLRQGNTEEKKKLPVVVFSGEMTNPITKTTRI